MSLASHDGTRLDLPWCFGPTQLLFSGRLALGMGDVADLASAGGGAQAGGEGRGSMCMHCALLPSLLLPFTAYVRSLDRASSSGGAQAGGEGGVYALHTAALPASALRRLCPPAVWGASVGGG